jgi:hypothetical protein
MDKNTAPPYDFDFSFKQITNPAKSIDSWFNTTTGAEQTPAEPITLIIAYEFDGAPLPLGVGPLRDMFIGSEGLVTWGTYSVYLVDTIVVGGQSPPYLTYSACNSNGVARNTFTTGDTVYFTATGLSTSTSYNAMVVPYESSWSTSMAIPTAVSTIQFTSDSSGSIALIPIYTTAQPGQYDIIIKPAAETDGTYDAQDLLITNVVAMPGPGLFVLPEYAIGGLGALAACFAVFIAYKSVKKKHQCPSLKYS